MMIHNWQLAKSLYEWKYKNSKRGEKKFIEYFKTMVEKIIGMDKFSGYNFGKRDLLNDMKANAYYYLAINLDKNNIKIKKIKVGEDVYIKCKKNILKKFNEENINEFEPIFGQKVKVLKRISNKYILVQHTNEETEEIMTHKINKFFVDFCNIYSYLTAIIIDSFWKVRNEQILQENKAKLYLKYSGTNDRNVTYMNDIGKEYISNESIEKLDFTSDTDNEKIEELRQKGMHKRKSRNRKSNPLAKHNVWE